MNLTKESALLATLAMWSELAESGDSLKPDTEFESNCPCCEFVCQTHGPFRLTGMRCADGEVSPQSVGCPLHTLWPMGCQHESSPFQTWRDAYKESQVELRRECASEIAEAARKELEALKSHANT